MEAKRRPIVGSHGASWPVVERISAAQVTARSCLPMKRSNIVTDLVTRKNQRPWLGYFSLRHRCRDLLMPYYTKCMK
jgi:hypothetical protein